MKRGGTGKRKRTPTARGLRLEIRSARVRALWSEMRRRTGHSSGTLFAMMTEAYYATKQREWALPAKDSAREGDDDEAE